MDVALGHIYIFYYSGEFETVLILVVMDVALGHEKNKLKEFIKES